MRKPYLCIQQAYACQAVSQQCISERLSAAARQASPREFFIQVHLAAMAMFGQLNLRSGT